MNGNVQDIVKSPFTSDYVIGLVSTHYAKSVQAAKIVGELDLNFYLTDGSGFQFILKIAHPGEELLQLQLQNAMIKELGSSKTGILIQKIVPSVHGEEIVSLRQQDGNLRYMRMLSWIEGRPLAKCRPHSPDLLYKVGTFCGKLCDSLKGFDHPGAHRFMKWDPSQGAWIKPHLDKFIGDSAQIAQYFYALYEREFLPLSRSLRKSVNYNDANDYNVLISGKGPAAEIAGLIDFGDAVHTHTVNELAIAIAYAAMEKPDPLAAASNLVAGFHSVFPLTTEEIKVIYPLMTMRLLISVTCAEINRKGFPDNSYLQISAEPAWNLLKKLRNIDPGFAEASFRQAAGFTPSPNEKRFRVWMEENSNLMVSPVELTSPWWLDLGVGSPDLGNYANFADADKLDSKITAMIMAHPKGTALGKYDEARFIYASPAFEQSANEGKAWRTIHIGLDFFSTPATAVKAACEGVVHSFANNSGEGDYGPTIILEHNISEDLRFFTLYGHLNKDSIRRISIGKRFQAGEKIAEIGNRSENGNWTPHLHFQIILDMLGRQGDFPGVCTPDEAPVWKSICPDPWLLLRGEPSANLNVLSNQEMIDYRKNHLGKNLSISYKVPIRMVRGFGQYLIDDGGRKYLDTVNNVAHVGHEHPRVVAAGQRQMGVLNTNTRYLHSNIIKFVEELLLTMPTKLNVAYVVNSGSEANELAMRIAKNFTGQQDMIVSEVGYHGNTNACVEISSYKFDGPGGRGSLPHVHVIPIPDLYRGLYRADDEEAGKKYAAHIVDAIAQMHLKNKKPAAFIFETVISCGGQVELPNGFLPAAYELTHKAGGVCIADEVQTGCGRAGDHFWAFQAHGVIPDIVTIGKPIGNGHPLGVVVTTQELADAFRNGMEYFNTFGGNPVSSAIGLEVLRVIKEEDLQKNAFKVGNYLKTGLRGLMNEFEIIGDVRGPGLFIGFELVKDRTQKLPATEQAAYFINRMRDKGILMSTDGPFNNVLKIKPPIVFTKNDSDFLLESIQKVLREDFMQIE